jgi:hypothetical protein
MGWKGKAYDLDNSLIWGKKSKLTYSDVYVTNYI